MPILSLGVENLLEELKEVDNSFDSKMHEEKLLVVLREACKSKRIGSLLLTMWKNVPTLAINPHGSLTCISPLFLYICIRFNYYSHVYSLTLFVVYNHTHIHQLPFHTLV